MHPDLVPYDQEDPSDLRVELAKLRSILAASEASPAFQRAICDSIKSCAAEFDKMQARRSLYVHRSAMLRWMGDFVQVINGQLNVLPEEQRDAIVDNLVAWMTDSRNAPGNEPGEIKALTGREYSK